MSKRIARILVGVGIMMALIMTVSHASLLNGQPVCLSKDFSNGKSQGIPAGQPLNNPSINYCGGDSVAGDPEAQRSCTPFMYKPHVSDYSGVGPLRKPPFNQATGFNDGLPYKVWAKLRTRPQAKQS